MKVRACDLCGEVIKGNSATKVRITPDGTEYPSVSGELCNECMNTAAPLTRVYTLIRNAKEALRG